MLYGAYALALELGIADVEGMLDSMTCGQFNMWLAFMNARAKLRGDEGKNSKGKRGGYGKSQNEQQRMARDIMKDFSGFQKTSH